MQIDGSRHAWLEERGPQLTLIAAIDDATGKLAAAVVRHEEDAAGYFLLVQQMLEQHGRPWHSIMIAMASSSKRAKPRRLTPCRSNWPASRIPPNSGACWKNWRSPRLLPAHPKPKGGSNGSLAPYKSG